MPKLNIDELVQKLLENSGKYPELKVYAEGLKELNRIASLPPKEKKVLTRESPSAKVLEQPMKRDVTLNDVMEVLGVGV